LSSATSTTIEGLTASSVTVDGAKPTHEVRKYAFIDALRGYAVLLVITCHTGGMFPNMPYPIKKLTNVGWHGVQLFFLISCVTLMMSWRSDQRKGIASAPAFWARRFFRIAPMYYLAGAFYFYFEPPDSGFSLKQLLASLTFVNAWHPTLIPTVPNSWMVVPGGWSIGVEFTFYMLFPLMVSLVKGARSGVAFFLLSFVFAGVANSFAYNFLVPQYGDTATSNFVYFWLPNQLPIFALGTLLFFAIDHYRDSSAPVASCLRRWPLLTVSLCVALFVAFAEMPDLFTAHFSVSPLQLFPFLLAASLIFMVCALTLALNPNTILVNRGICMLGEVSFSAYILHFFVLHWLSKHVPFIDVQRTDYPAIGTLALLWVMTLPCTFALSKITYELIERPMIKFGAKLIADLRAHRGLAKAKA
jgi:peptidoglycan/LPS O-acetylase OafA/YrhL